MEAQHKLKNQEKLNIFKKFGYNPHMMQLKMHVSDARFKCVAAGSRAGKSMSCGAEAVPVFLEPKKNIWFCANCYELADKEFDWFLSFLAKIKMGGRNIVELCQKLGKFQNPSRGPRRIEAPWGSIAETKSSMKTETLLGSEIDMLILGEASQIMQEVWDRQLYARLGPRRGVVLAPSTPNWDSGFFRKLYDKGLSEHPDDSEYESWQFSVLANPTFPVEEYEKAKKTLDKKVFDEQYDGLFTTRRGIVLPQFKIEKHVFSEFPENFESWPVFVTAYHEKSSFNNPLVVLAIAVEPSSKKLWVFKEWHQTQILVEDVLADVSKMLKGKLIAAIISDYYNPVLTSQLKKCLGAAFVSIEEKKHTRRHAFVRKIQILQTVLKKEQIIINSGCENVLSEFSNMKWKEEKKENLEMLEDEMPSTKYISSPVAIGQALAFLEKAQGVNIYKAQK